MASGSPTVHSRLKAAHSPMTHSRHFVEDSPRTRIELARNNLVMQKELVKIEKQAKTAAMNVSNNQQALRMSLRQLESKRSSDSPLLTRSAVMDKKDSNASKRKLGLFANNTSLSVESTADAYKNSAAAVTGGRARSRSTSEHRSLHDSERASAENGRIVAAQIVINPVADNGEEDGPVFRPAVSTAPAVQHNAADHQSPYISTPLNVRRVKLSQPFHSLSASQHLPVRTTTVKDHNRPATQEAPLSQSCHTIHSLYNKPCNVSGDSDELNHRRGSLKLPPINATRTIISAHHNTTDKATLKKASQLLGMSSASISNTRSSGPTSFKQFYKDAGSSLIVVSPPATPCGDRDDIEQSFDSDDEEMANGDVQNADSNVSLSEMFEQIKKCRYIRHYYPNGEKPPDAW